MVNQMIPLTGDETQIWPYIIVCGVAVVLIVVLIVVSVLARKRAMAKLNGQDPELETVSLEDSETTKETDKEEAAEEAAEAADDSSEE